MDTTTMLNQDDVLTVVTLEEHGMPLTAEGRDDIIGMIVESYPEFEGKVTAFVSGNTANDPASLANILQNNKNTAIVVGFDDYTDLVDRDDHADIIEQLLALPAGVTSWKLLAEILDERPTEA